MSKPIKAKPLFYALCYQKLQSTARDMGYNLLIHGSMDRDMDLVVVAWIDNPKSHIEVLNAFCDVLGVKRPINPLGFYDYLFTMLPAGRSSYIIDLNRGGKFNNYFDEQMYLDISFTPIT
jgi:hypothetical protein